MASSRWKRFAFFERHVINFPSDVVEDIIPIGSEAKVTSSSSRRSLQTLQAAADETVDDSVDLVLTSAALPLASKPHPDAAGIEDWLGGMWNSVTACTAPPSDAVNASYALKSIRLPNQCGRPADDDLTIVGSGLPNTSAAAVEGLVLAFLSSRFSSQVHCVDVTVRCNPPLQGDPEDLDGWRGYFAPFGQAPHSSSSANPIGDNDSFNDKVRAISVCRSTVDHKPVVLACIASQKVCLWEDPHLHLTCRRPIVTPVVANEAIVYNMQSPVNGQDGEFLSVNVIPSLVAVGTTSGAALIFAFSSGRRVLRHYLKIPPPPSGKSAEAVAVKLSVEGEKAAVIVTYRHKTEGTAQTSAGICCYEFPLPLPSPTVVAAPSARHDLDGRSVGSASLVDSFATSKGLKLTVARLDGLYSYSSTERIGVAPIDGVKLVMSVIPPCTPAKPVREVATDPFGYALVASTDSKSGRDCVDVYDADNKLVAFHLLLSPGHCAVRSAGLATKPSKLSDGTVRPGRAAAVVFTSGGSLITLTEKLTAEKIALLVQKNLFSAAIVVAYADPSFEADEVIRLYREYAEYLYRKGDFGGAMEQYIQTIGSLESSHVLYRYLDAPKIPYLVRYLEQLRSRGYATPMHIELLRTCYLKLNDSHAAEELSAVQSKSIDKGSMESVLSMASSQPKEALAVICSLDASQAAEVLAVHGASLARVLPRETAGIVIALCVGTYSPKSLADAALVDSNDLKKMIERKVTETDMISKPYPVSLFAAAFIEHPKMLRLILAHCNRNRCPLTPSLRRTLLELTLAEWNQAKRSGDTEVEKLRHKEAIAVSTTASNLRLDACLTRVSLLLLDLKSLTDSHCYEIGDYNALVLVQQAGFEEGELLLYERLQMTPMLLERYAKDGSEKSRRQMLAMCKTDPTILSDVLGHLVTIASEKSKEAGSGQETVDDSEHDEIMDDIQEALSLARRQGVLPPVRIARILAGESSGQFSSEGAKADGKKGSIPLAVALDYVGSILEESRKEINRLHTEVEEYSMICNDMEAEIQSLSISSTSQSQNDAMMEHNLRMNIDYIYAKLREEVPENSSKVDSIPAESFWREMNQSEDRFDIIAKYFAKGIIN